MDLISTPSAAAEWTAARRREGRKVGFVPTMGALHDGHMRLIHRALGDDQAVVCSVFVNPLQFTNPSDLAHYPRTIERDSAMLKEAGCHMLFHPTDEAIYAGFRPKTYALGGLDALWEGASRPGHFQGVVNVVERLFHYVRPDRAYFGEKDRQQLTIIKHVASELRWPEEIIPCPIVREPDGLAMSSRNQRLGAEDRQRAAVLHRTLRAVAGAALNEDVGMARSKGLAVLREEPSVELDYLAIVDPSTLQPLDEWKQHLEAVALIAAQVGPVRLIDNLILHR